MLGPLITIALGTALRGIIWLVYGPLSGVIPLLLLYGMIEFGLDFFATRSRRLRRLDASMLSSCTLGIVVWLMKPHIPPILLGLLGLSIAATVAALILDIRGKGRARRFRLAAEEADAPEGTPSEETELAQS